MTNSTVEVLCYWNGTILRIEMNLRYIGNNVEIVEWERTELGDGWRKGKVKRV